MVIAIVNDYHKDTPPVGLGTLGASRVPLRLRRDIYIYIYIHTYIYIDIYIYIYIDIYIYIYI